MVEEREESKVSVAESRGREEKDSWSGRDERVQEATEEGEIEWRFWWIKAPQIAEIPMLSLAKKAQSRLYFLPKMRKARVPPPIMCSCTASCQKSLQRIVYAASKIIGVSLPSLVDIFHTSLTSRAIGIAADGSHPSNLHFSLLPSGRSVWCTCP
ncbi:hypothetical protein QTP70_009558 [Hemibagrus guttatus]|uniref:Alkylated DNA repair protein AlkB homologue 8 N-terminal domain-containing protein n=1 Tax=Hemibagrus guttatus TaxID=175788 RepID=A0AAE0VA35_9TELE|nr:hypothetical protein QTP70_009558 [Hemibagrus guttatus]